MSVSLPPDRRTKLIAATRDAAAAFAEDISHIREILNRLDPDRGELRRLSGTLRRLLIDNGGDLRNIAAPRIGRLTLLTPDNKPFYDAHKNGRFDYFASAGVTVFGLQIRAPVVAPAANARVPNFDPERCIPLPLDNFLAQRVLLLKATWITRREAIKFMANVGSGVHSAVPKNEVERTIARLRRTVTYNVEGDALRISFNVDSLGPSELTDRYLPNSIDPVHVEIIATAHFLATSPDIKRLEEIVSLELA